MKTSDSPNHQGPPGGCFPWILVLISSCFYLYEYILRVAPSIMVHDLMVHFNITAGALGALSGLYYYAYSPMQIAVGVLLDRFGGRRILPLAVALAAGGSLIFGLSDELWMAGVGRILQGLGSAFAFVGAVYVATNWFPEKNFGVLSGIITMLGMLGAAIGQAPLAFVVRHTGWEASWLGAAAAGGLLAILLAVMIPKRPVWAQKPKTTANGTEKPIPILKNLGRVLVNPQTWLVGLYGGLIYVPTSAFAALWGVPFLKTAYQVNAVPAAGAVSMVFIGWIFGGPLAGWLSDKIGKRKPPMIWGTVGVFIFSTAVIYLQNIPFWSVFVLMFLIGFFSGGQVVCFASGYELNRRNAKGSSLAAINMLVMVSGAVMQPLVGWLLDLRWQPHPIVGTKHFTTADFHFALMAIPGCVLLALILAFFIKETYGKVPE